RRCTCHRGTRLAGFPDLRGFTLRNLAELARMKRDLVRATRLYEKALAVARATGMTFGVALIMTMLGHLAYQQQNYALAKFRNMCLINANSQIEGKGIEEKHLHSFIHPNQNSHTRFKTASAVPTYRFCSCCKFAFAVR